MLGAFKYARGMSDNKPVISDEAVEAVADIYAGPWDEEARRDAVASEFFAPSYQSASPYEQDAIRYIVELEYRLWHFDANIKGGRNADQ